MQRWGKLAVVAGLLTVAGLAFLTGYLEVLVRLFGDPQYLQETVRSHGPLGAALLVTLHVIQILVAVIPAQAIGVTYGLIYGVFWGTVFGMVGSAIGTVLALLIAKRYGRDVVESIVGERRFETYESVTESADVYLFVFLMVLPVIPDDVVVYLAGLTNIRTRRLVLWLVPARLPGLLSLTWFGEGIADANYALVAGLLLLMTVVSAWVIWKRDELLQNE